jgi:hypothetical protein
MTTTGANLKTVSAIREFRSALVSFMEDAKLALAEAHADVLKTHSWIQHDRIAFWQHALKKRHEKVQIAKSELTRAQLQSRDERPSCVVERKALAKAQAEWDEAQRKVESCRRALTLLDREGLLFKAALGGFSTALELDLPNGVAHLDRLMDTLDKYFSIVAPADATRDAKREATSNAPKSTGAAP